MVVDNTIKAKSYADGLGQFLIPQIRIKEGGHSCPPTITVNG